jgi:HAD superfamily hydrolase (TIGR01509 family)
LTLDDWLPAAIVFDCDGLLVDTEPCWTVAETALFARRGLAFGPAEKKLLIGKSLASAGVMLEDIFGEPGRGAELGAELQELVGEVIAAEAEPMPGAHALVELAAARMPIAVASNSSRHLLDLSLTRGGFDGRFAVTIAADEVAHPKPAPDLYREACARLGVSPEKALALEDSMTGMRSALAAGLRLISIPTIPQPDLPGDWILPSLEDPALVSWLERAPVPGR